MAGRELPMLIATISTQRSGTKFLGSCFEAGTQIRPLGELFDPLSTYLSSFSTFVARQGYSNLIAESSETVLDRFFCLLLPDRLHFDLMFNQLEAACLSYNDFGIDFIYEYLKSRQAVVISLERPLAECFVSRKFVELGGAPHYYGGEPFESPVTGIQTLSGIEFGAYLVRTREQQTRLLKNMEGYEYFYRLKYEMLAESQVLPCDLKQLIVRVGTRLGKQVDGKYIQIHQPRTIRTPISYPDIFANYEEIMRAARNFEETLEQT